MRNPGRERNAIRARAALLVRHPAGFRPGACWGGATGYSCQPPNLARLTRSDQPSYYTSVSLVGRPSGLPNIRANGTQETGQPNWLCADMALTPLQSRITVEPGKCGGRPCIRRMRIRVKDVLEMLAAGATEEQILIDYPDLERDDIRACLEYAAQYFDHPVVVGG